jgi:hypothetical protein
MAFASATDTMDGAGRLILEKMLASLLETGKVRNNGGACRLSQGRILSAQRSQL